MLATITSLMMVLMIRVSSTRMGRIVLFLRMMIPVVCVVITVSTESGSDSMRSG